MVGGDGTLICLPDPGTQEPGGQAEGEDELRIKTGRGIEMTQAATTEFLPHGLTKCTDR